MAGEEDTRAKVVNVTPLPGGAGELHFNDGRPPLPVVPEIAEEHRQRLAASGPGSSAPDLAKQDRDSFVNTAKAVGNWFTTPVDRGPEATPLAGDTQAPAQAPAPSDPVSGRPLPPGVRIAGPGEMPPTPPPGPAPAPQDVPPPMLARDQGEQSAPHKEDDSIEAMALEILRRKMAGGGGHGPARMAPVSEKTEFSRGTPYDIGQARDRLTADEAVKDAAFSKMRAEKAGYDAQAAAAAAQIPKLQLEQARAQNDVERREKEYQTERAGLEKELTDYDKSAKVDPRRFFSGDRAVSGMLSVIGSALGAFGASLSHTQNWAFEAMQKQIQQDIDAQVQDITNGHGQRATALKRFVDYYHGDMGKAQNALAIAMNKAVTTEAARFAAQSKSQDIANNAASFSALFDQASQKREQDLYNAALGTSKTEVTSKMQGGGGGGGQPSLDDLIKLQKIQGKSPEDRQGFGGLKAKDILDTGVKYAERKQQVVQGRAGLSEEAKAYGFSIDWAGRQLLKDGKPFDPDKADIPGIGRIKSHIPDVFISDEGNDVRRAQTKSVSAYLNAISGGAFTPQEEANARNVTVGVSPRDAVVTLARRINEVANTDLHLDASVPKQIVDEYNRRAVEAKGEQSKSGSYGVRPGTGQ